MSGFDPNAAADRDAGIFGLDDAPEDAGVVLLPVPWDATASYRDGAAGGPAAILHASHQVDLFDVDTGRPYEAGIAMLADPDGVSEWNLEARAAAVRVMAGDGTEVDRARWRRRVDERSERVDDVVRGTVERWLDRGKLVGVVGGDHSAPLGAIEAVAARTPELGILHLDAHADLREAYEGFSRSHASIMFNVLERAPHVTRLVQVGVRDLCDEEADRIAADDRVITHFDSELASRRFAGETWASQCEAIVSGLPADVYLSFDIDGLDPALCPGTGTPVPGGLSFQQASFLLGALVGSGRRVVGFDLCEVAPRPIEGDEWDGNVGARLLYKMIGWALQSRRG